ncbi:SsgA family sporulation/cell division regulator [Streptomyces sp. TRM76323]|uniref:SsgA family sporulation/cell division regulator n=1 Tax=Streptomyces tamarix TaxID=3078565 RepID=A0ABU3QTM9_9ACTN|nr:SsgA family sporulation/cell division regulator [Streptomyces tamarix]MDT9686146.1 SsgA family sporulation/cell division regulator [Streptomyces tamarix]
MSTVIEQALRARLVASAPRADVVPAVLRYDPADPFAVRMVFPAPATLDGAEAVWEFSRELLAAGTDAPAGVGDVRIRPFGHDRTAVELRAAEGVAVVHVRTGEVRRFLRRTEHVVPFGCEPLFLDLDRDLARLLRDAS